MKTTDAPAYVEYLGAVIGSTIMAISEDDDSVRLHMSGGHAMEVTAMSSGGFAITIVLPMERH